MGKLNRKFLLNAFGGKCQICGFDECTAALEFHHRDPKKKKINISKFANNKNLTYPQIRELEGCILCCANCHRKIHAGLLDKELEEIPEIQLLESLF